MNNNSNITNQQKVIIAKEKQMTSLEAIEKIRKLPKLKEGYFYKVYENGGVDIHSKKGNELTIFENFGDLLKNNYSLHLWHYHYYLSNPIHKDKKIVGYE